MAVAGPDTCWGQGLPEEPNGGGGGGGGGLPASAAASPGLDWLNLGQSFQNTCLFKTRVILSSPPPFVVGLPLPFRCPFPHSSIQRSSIPNTCPSKTRGTVLSAAS